MFDDGAVFHGAIVVFVGSFRRPASRSLPGRRRFRGEVASFAIASRPDSRRMVRLVTRRSRFLEDLSEIFRGSLADVLQTPCGCSGETSTVAR